MKFMITGKNIALTDALKNTVEKKLGKLEKYFNPEVEIHATLSVQKNRQTIEVTIPFNGILLRGEESTTDMYLSIDNVVDKLEKQIMKHRTRLERRTHDGSLRLMEVPSEVAEEEEPQVVKTKRFAVKPIDIGESECINFDMVGSGSGLPVSIIYSSQKAKFPNEILSIARSQNIPAKISINDSSDHTYFCSNGINAVTLIQYDVTKIHTPNDTMENIAESGFRDIYSILDAYLSTREVYSSSLKSQTADPAIRYLLPGAGILIITTAAIFYVLNKNGFGENNI